MPPITFVLNDESAVNSYGFRVLTAGIDLTRFTQNPVMLDAHTSTSAGVIGRWVNIRKEGGRLLADAEFDTEDAAAQLIAGKVARGFLKGVSIGMEPKKWQKEKSGVEVLETCELLEASVCPIPSSATALKLYSPAGKVLEWAKLKVELSKNATNPQPPNMNFLEELSSLLQLPAGATEQDIIEALKKLIESQSAAATKQAEELVNDAIKEGKLTISDRASFTRLALHDYGMAADAIKRIAPRQSLSAMISNKGAGKTAKDYKLYADTTNSINTGRKAQREDWTLEDWRKNAPKELAANPTLYAELIKLEYGNQ